MKYVEPPHPRQEPRFAGELTGEHRWDGRA